MQKKTATKSGNKGVKAALLTLNFLALIGLGAFGAQYYTKYNDLKNNPPSQEEVAKAELATAIDRIGKLYGDLPNDEEPQLATVKDKELLKDQAFFAKAENGDQALFYVGAELAILYRPSTNQIINVSTVNIQSEAPKVQVIGPRSSREAIEKKLQEAFSDQIEIAPGKTAANEYESTIVVAIGEDNEAAAQQIAQTLSAEVGPLPEGERAADGVGILVITSTQ
jgi:hypothetical protein